MTYDKAVYNGLCESAVDTVAYLPDTVLEALIDRVRDDDTFRTVRVAREEEAVSLLGGTWLGGGRGALICQSSGLANTFNAIGSHALPYHLPFLALVSHRGDLGERNRAQIAGGYGLPRMLDDLGVRNHRLTPDAAVAGETKLAADTVFDTKTPYVLFLEQTLTGGQV
jgi:sulfopyruvate decarboxylase alpha subunit